MSAGVLPGTARALRLTMARAQVDGRLPSLVAGVVRDDELAWCEGYGDVPGAPDDTHYRIGSITKTMTAVLVLQLVEEDRLELSTPIGAVLGPVTYGDRTVGDLLSHAAGLPAEPAGAWWERAGRSDAFTELMAAETGRGPVLAAASRFHYTNLGFAMLGEAVARLRGEAWWDVVQARILVPLEMGRTSYHPDAGAARGWSVHPHSGALLPEPSSDTGAMAPAGQLWSTVADLGRWGRFLLDGHPAVLSPSMLATAGVPRSTTLARGLDAAHGLGLAVVRSGATTLVGHTGSMPGFLAACFVDRTRRTVAVALANATAGLDPSGFAGSLLATLEREEPTIPAPWRPSTTVPAPVVDLLGRWYWGATPHDFAWEGAEVVVRGPGGDVTWRYRVVDDSDGQDAVLVGTHGYQDAEELLVVRRPDGTISHLDLATFVLTRTPYDPAAPIPGAPPPKSQD